MNKHEFENPMDPGQGQNEYTDYRYRDLTEIAIAIACLSFFPLMYLIGKTVFQWAHSYGWTLN